MTDHPPPQPDVPQYRYIDALRGYAILGVIALHVSQVCVDLDPTAARFLFEGVRGVQLFFVASALTLTASWHARQDGIGSFYLRRLFRIAPLFWLAIAFYTVWSAAQQGVFPPAGMSWTDLLLTASFTHGFSVHSDNEVVPGDWTIAVEMLFYLVFPLLMALITSLRRALIAFAASLLFSVVFGLATLYLLIHAGVPAGEVQLFVFYQLPSQLPVFLVGIGVFFALRRFPWTGTKLALNLWGCGVLAVLLYSPFIDLGPANHIWYGLLFGALAYFLASGAVPFVANRLVAFIGVLSFGGYLIHFVVIGFFPHPANPGPLAFIALYVGVCAVTFALAAVCHYAIERPGIALGKRVIARLSAQRQLKQAAGSAP